MSRLYFFSNKNANRIIQAYIVFSLIGAFTIIFYTIEIFDPQGRISKSSPSNSVFAGLLLLFFSLLAVYRFKEFVSLKREKQNFLDFSIFVCTLLCLVSFICWIINPVTDLVACYLFLLTFMEQFLLCLLIVQIRSKVIVDREFIGINKSSSYSIYQTDVKNKKFQTLKCLKTYFCFIVNGLIIIITLLITLQLIHEASSPQNYSSEFDTKIQNNIQASQKFFTIKFNGYDINFRTFCTGNIKNPPIILESGGGSSGIDLYSIQISLSDQYRVCSYDRAGYGMSWQGPSPQSFQNTMEQMVNVFSLTGMNMDQNKSIVCIGHSVGGQLCRYYAKQLKSIKGVILLDSVPTQKWFYLVGKKKGLNADQVYSQQVAQISTVRIIAQMWPLYIGSVFVGHGHDFNPSEFQKWVNWQITTTRNWFAQYLGVINEVTDCDPQCMQRDLNVPENILDVPLAAITASNSMVTCEDRNLVGQACQDYLDQRDVTIELSRQQSNLGSQGYFEECPGICQHDFVWVKPDYLAQRIKNYLLYF